MDENKENIKVKFKFKNILIYIILIIAIVAVIYLITIVNKNKSVENSDELSSFSIDYEASAKADFYASGIDIFYTTKDGVQLLNNKGETKWTDTYTMINPYICSEGEIIAVADENGTYINVYDKSGKLYNVNGNEEVITFSVNLNGYLIAVFKNNSDYLLNVYNNLGEIISTGKYPFDDGMPISIDISDDNRIFAISFVDINDIKMRSKVLFYYTKKEDAQNSDSSDGMFASFIRDEEIIAKIKFMEDNNMVAISDTEMVGVKFNNNKNYEEKWSVPFENKLTALNFLDNKYVVIGYGDKNTTAQNPYNKNTVCFYNMAGDVSKTFELSNDITSISANNGMAVVGMNRHFEGFTNLSNKSIWTYTATQDINNIISYDGGSKVIFVTPNKMSLINIGKRNITEAVSEEATNVEEISTEANTSNASEPTTTAVEEITTAEETTIIE